VSCNSSSSARDSHLACPDVRFALLLSPVVALPAWYCTAALEEEEGSSRPAQKQQQQQQQQLTEDAGDAWWAWAGSQPAAVAALVGAAAVCVFAGLRLTGH
jgi:hypothetical protein